MASSEGQNNDPKKHPWVQRIGLATTIVAGITGLVLAVAQMVGQLGPLLEKFRWTGTTTQASSPVAPPRGTLGAGQAANREKARTALEEGHELFRRSQFDAAVEKYKEVIDLYFNDSKLKFSAYVNRGHIYKRRGASTEAINDFKNAIKSNPSNPPEDADPYVNLGDAYNDRGDKLRNGSDFNCAIKSYTDAISVISYKPGLNDPALNFSAYINREHAHRNKNELNRNENDLNCAIEDYADDLTG